MKNTYVLTDYGVCADCESLQTAAIQRVFDLCRADGGTVVVPAGRFRTGSLRMWSDTTLLLQTGAILAGSDDCNDYEVYDVPEGVELCTDMELIGDYYREVFNKEPWPTYRRAILSAYGEHDIAVLGEPGSFIDGADCYDPDGEEGYRGPHGIFFTNCVNVRMEGYTIQHCGNFMHQLDKCTDTVMHRVTCLGGSDGIHLHCCVNTAITECIFRTGDDCIAGINVEHLLVRDCVMNTSCNIFRLGGSHVLVENCHMYGPGYYPHRKTVVKSRTECLPREAGRHNLICLLDYFASVTHPAPPSRDIIFRRCLVENAESLLNYHADSNFLQTGAYLAELTLEDVRFTGLNTVSYTDASSQVPLTVTLKNVDVAFREGAACPEGLLSPRDPYLRVVTADKP